MRTRMTLTVALAAALLAALGTLVAPAAAQEPPVLEAPGAQGAGAPPAIAAQSWVLVDADTGAVLSAHNDRVAVPPASTIKLLTALIVVQRLDRAELIPIGPLAEGMPARKINVKAGQYWRMQDLLHSMLLVSANDAAVALAERIGGTLDGYAEVAGSTAERLGLVDQPVLYDPSGLDDEFSHRGGSLISARDLAIVARAVLAEPALMEIVQTPRYEFTGGDDIGHVLRNGDLFLQLYPGATGLKTGTTDRAGRTFVASATRDGRTMLAVVFDSPDVYATATQLLDTGFATPAAAQGGLPKLPDLVDDAALEVVAAAHPADVSGLAAGPGAGRGRFDFNSTPVAITVLVIGLAPLIAFRRRLAAAG